MKIFSVLNCDVTLIGNNMFFLFIRLSETNNLSQNKQYLTQKITKLICSTNSKLVLCLILMRGIQLKLYERKFNEYSFCKTRGKK